MEPSHEYCDAVRWALSLIPMIAANDKLFLSNSCRRYTVNINGIIRRSIFRRTRLVSSELGSNDTCFCASNWRALSLLASWALTPVIWSPVSAIPISSDWHLLVGFVSRTRHGLVLPWPLCTLYQQTCWVQTFRLCLCDLLLSFSPCLSHKTIFIIPETGCRRILLSDTPASPKITHRDYWWGLKRAIEMLSCSVHFRKL